MSSPGSSSDLPGDVVDRRADDVADPAESEPSEDKPAGGADDTLTDVASVDSVAPEGASSSAVESLPSPTPPPPGSAPTSLPSVPGDAWLRPRRSRGPAHASGSTDRRKSRVSGRIVHERLRHVSPLSVLKIAAIFYTCIAVVFLVSTVVLWQFARGTGFVEDTEDFVTDLFAYGNCVPEEDLDLGEEFRADDTCSEGRVMVGGFEIESSALFRAVLIGGIVFVVAATAGTVFLVVLFNLLSDVTGGVRYSIVREPLSPGAAPKTGSTSRPGQR